ncbi:MFS transporter [Microbispora rosea subsp. aerata]|nr:MFS transporter [Microbispora rosea]GGO05909.1 MFS transporter [Microbispora rosea subsp. aerata]GIH55230.1 MFS transporter [Microbispora rosea subsp. aerata]GLJ82680.1 MFS transporter [Microbispora rosea subsp. aerata]
MTKGSQLWRNRDFSIFWASQTLSVAGDSFALIAVPLLVLHTTGSVAQMGLLTGVASAASVVSGVFAGVLVDRIDRRRLLIWCDLARMALYGLVPAAWVFGPQIWLLYIVLPLCEAIGMVFQVAYVTAVRGLVDADHITEANGRLGATAAAAGVGGPLLAGVVAGWFGSTAAIAINAAGFGVSALGIALIRLRTPSSPAPEEARGTWQELLAGARFLWRQPVLRALTVLLSFFIFLTLGLTDVLIYHLKHDLHQPDGAVGVVLGVAALGTVAGSLLVGPVRRRLGFGVCWIGAIAVAGVAIAGLGLSTAVPVAAAAAAAYLACTSVAGICSMSLRQQVTPDHLLGRVTSAFWTIHFSLGPAGAAVLTWGAQHHGVAVVCLLAGAACLLIAVAAFFTPIRQPNPELSGATG